YGPSLFTITVARSCGVIALSSQRYYMDSVPPKYRATVLASHWLAHGVVANSEGIKTYLHQRFHYPAARLHVCPNGLDPDAFFPVPREESKPLVIGTLCVLRWEKNLEQLLHAFAKLRSETRDIRLLIVGSGPEESKLKAMAVQLGLKDVSTFMPSQVD